MDKLLDVIEANSTDYQTGLKGLNDAELALIGGGCAESTPY